MLEQNEYEALEAIVGIENISQTPAVLDTYAFQWAAEVLCVENNKPPSRYYIRPAAVVLPASTQEIQRVVEICNQFNISFKAFSTGLGPWNCVSSERTIHVDLRRMNKILKIDAKNLYAVVEPYVSGAQLQSETMKFGLNCGMPGAGPQVSPLASATSMCGMGFTSAATGFAGRSVLGVEWVLPTGELLRLGSIGQKNHTNWFSGDGPGPSLRGIMRGFVGAKSGLGIFTKVAVKLYPFPAKPEWKVQGESPDYEFEIPNYMKLYIINYKSWDAHIYASYTKNSCSFPEHSDQAHNIIVQQKGKSKWIVKDFCETILQPGDMIYIPYQWKHQCIPTEKRLSLSFPFWIE